MTSNLNNLYLRSQTTNLSKHFSSFTHRHLGCSENGRIKTRKRFFLSIQVVKFQHISPSSYFFFLNTLVFLGFLVWFFVLFFITVWYFVFLYFNLETRNRTPNRRESTCCQACSTQRMPREKLGINKKCRILAESTHGLHWHELCSTQYVTGQKTCLC